MSSNGNIARVRVALDAMGGDYGPEVTVPGALAAVAAHPQLTSLPWWVIQGRG